MTQKVLKVGNSDIIIPKRTLKELGLRPGDEITVSIRSKGMTKRQKKIAELTLDFIDRYRKDLEALARK